MLTDKVTHIPELLDLARAGSTMLTYQRAFRRWKAWALCNSVEEEDIFPAKPLIFAIYLCSVAQSSNSQGPVNQAFYSVKHMHEIVGMNSPTESSLVRNVLEGAKRKLSRAVVKKEPITIKILNDMYDRLYQYGNLKNQRSICACLLAYAGFLRSEELLKIRRSDLVFENSHLAIFIESSKTDQYRDGAWVLIARTGTKLCPVGNLEKFLAWGGIETDFYIFCRMTKCKNVYKLRNIDNHICMVL